MPEQSSHFLITSNQVGLCFFPQYTVSISGARHDAHAHACVFLDIMMGSVCVCADDISLHIGSTQRELKKVVAAKQVTYCTVI